MFSKSALRLAVTFSRYRHLKKDHLINFKRNLRLSQLCLKNDNKTNETTGKEVVTQFSFEDIKEKNKNTYLEMIQIFVDRNTVHRRGHVEFVYAALKNMEEFGVQKDLQVYKALIDVMPKGKFIPQNLFQVEFMHYPKQQQCIIDLLQQMEDNGVMPDYEVEDMLMNIFGAKGYPLRKFWRMMYWMPKFKNLSPWPVPSPLPSDVFDLAKIAIARISSADINSKLTVYQTSDIPESIEDTWIVSAQSPKQKTLLEEHNKNEPIYVEGAFRVWIKEKAVNYFILRGNPKPLMEQEIENPDGDQYNSFPFVLLKSFPFRCL